MSEEVADPYVEPSIQHGVIRRRDGDEKLISRSMELDTMPLSFQDDRSNVFKKGTVIDGYPNMPIVDRERTKTGPVYMYKLLLEGIEDTEVESVETDYQESAPEEGWDEIRRTVVTRNPTNAWFAKGAQLVSELTGLVLPGYEYMWVMDRGQRRHRAKGYFEITMALKGLIAEKPYKRRYSGTPQVVSPGQFDGLTAEYFDTYVGFPPVAGDPAFVGGEDLTIEWDIPQVSITDVFVTSTPPPTDKFPGFWTPNDPPAVFYMPVFAASYTVHVPYGWKISNMQAEQLAGQQMFILSLTFGTQAANTPKA